MVQPTQTRINAAKYFELPEHQERDLIELIDGEVVLRHASTPRHQSIVGELLFMLITYSRQYGGETYQRPTEVHLDDYNVFEPDILYFIPDTQCVVGIERIVGAPELIVEVLSPTTAKHDRQEKYLAYEKNGVHEYWIIDPEHETMEVWVLQNDKFQRQAAYGRNDTFTSALLKQKVSVGDFFASV